MKNRLVLTLFIAHGVLWLLFLFMYGFNFSIEGHKYLSEATQLFENGNSTYFKDQLFSSIYILYLALLLSIKLSPVAIVVVTHLFFLFACFRFYRYLLGNFGNKSSSFFLGAVLLNPLFIHWNLSLYSESFFIAMSLLTTLMNLGQSPSLPLQLFINMLLIFTRPQGLIFSAVTWLAGLSIRRRLSFKRCIYILSALLSLVFLVVFFFLPLHFEGIAKGIMQGAVTYGFPQYSEVLPPGNYTLFECYRFLYQQSGFTGLIKIELMKLLVFFNLNRGYYSLSHNLANGLNYIFILIHFVFWALSLKNKLHTAQLVSFIQLLLLFNVCLVMVFYNEWTERYILVLMPFFIVSSALFLGWLWPEKNHTVI